RSSALRTRSGRSQAGSPRKSISAGCTTPVTFSPTRALYSLKGQSRGVSMVRSWVLRFFSGVALACAALLAVPHGASAQQQQPTDLRFETAITSAYGSQYPITGRLDIQIFPAGNLRGYYHTSYNKLFIDVVGGRDGDYIWFDIGP